MKEFEIAQKIGKELTDNELREAAAKALGVRPEQVGDVKVVRRSVDARQEILYRYRVQACRSTEKLEPFTVAPYLDTWTNVPHLCTLFSMLFLIHYRQQILKRDLIGIGKY